MFTVDDTLELIKNNVKVAWTNLEEGYNGDYDPDDENDVNLLRFDIYKDFNGEWELVQDGSYCTLVPANTNDATLIKLLKMIMRKIYEPLNNGESIKKICEMLSQTTIEEN